MINLPNVPANTAITVVAVGTLALFAHVTNKRTAIESQIHDNYRHATVVAANVSGADVAHLSTEKAARTAS